MIARGTLSTISLIVRRSLDRHALSTAVTTLSVALGVGLVTALFVLRAEALSSFTAGAGNVEAVLGPRGSQLQLVISSIFHLETSSGNIPWDLYESMREDGRVAMAIPLALGDSYRGSRVVGTSLQAFSELEVAPGVRLRPQPPGRLFDETRREALVGSVAATRSALRLGDLFHPTHGVVGDAGHSHDDEYVVVGLLEPTGTPADRAIWIPIEGVLRMSGHVLRGGDDDYHPSPDQAIPDEARELSAVLMRFHSPTGALRFDETINRRGHEATLAWPVDRSLAQLFERFSWMENVLAAMAMMVSVIAAASILAALSSAMNERRREMAILRALGARRRLLVSAVVTESTFIALAGSVLGLLVHLAILLLVARFVRDETGVVLDVFAWHPVLALAPLAMAALGALAGVLPAWRAYATDVSTALAQAASR